MYESKVARIEYGAPCVCGVAIEFSRDQEPMLLTRINFKTITLH